MDRPNASARGAPAAWQGYVPKLVTMLRRGYGVADLRHDLVAGLTVSVVALPLAMALAIASGASPEKGLHTAIVAGFLISALGGSRVQIGGPTAAFVPVVFVVIERFGYGGLILCTLLAGLLLIAAGLARLGTLMKYVPQTVVTGFTAGIAVSIFSSQVKDLLGLDIAHVPAEFVARWRAYAGALPTLSIASTLLALGTVATIALVRRWRPAWPTFLIAVAAASLVAAAFALPIDTLGTRFGGIPAALPTFALPTIPFSRTLELLPSALTIAFLAGVESLLSAVVADGMTGGRHRSNVELVAQGIANIGSALFGALPATGAIARTATNVRAGARSPIAGIAHAAFLLVFMLALGPLMRYVPLAALAGVLVVVAWNMAERDALRYLLRGPMGDRAVLLLTFALTVAFDLTVAIEAGVVLAAFVFMHRMADVASVESHAAMREDDDDAADVASSDQRAELPPGVEAFRVSGPLFFGATGRFNEALDALIAPPRVFILRMALVPMIDASGASAIRELIARCRRHGTRVILSGLRPQPRDLLVRMRLTEEAGVELAPDFQTALALAARPAGLRE